MEVLAKSVYFLALPSACKPSDKISFIPSSSPQAANRETLPQISDRLGFKILPPEGLVSGIGDALLDAHEPDKAVEVIKLNVTNYPTSAYAHRFLAYAYLAAGKKLLAIQN